jgi:hypothetical protein
VFGKFPKYRRNILLWDFNAKVDKWNIFKQQIWNETLHEIRNDTGFRLVIIVKSKNLRVKSTLLPYCNIHKYSWTCPDGKTHN